MSQFTGPADFLAKARAGLVSLDGERVIATETSILVDGVWKRAEEYWPFIKRIFWTVTEPPKPEPKPLVKIIGDRRSGCPSSVYWFAIHVPLEHADYVRGVLTSLEVPK